MQLGAESRLKVGLAAGLMVIALVLIGQYLFSTGGSEAAPAAAASAPTPAARPGTGKHGKVLRTIDPALRYDFLRASEETTYEGKGRNIFKAFVDIPVPVAKAVKEQPPVQTGPPPPPPPPPINLKFFGFASKPGEPKRIFLAKGDDIFVAQEGDIIDRRYKIVKIAPTGVEVEDVLNNNRQNIPLTQG